jgi:retron-type reverse transcriptase
MDEITHPGVLFERYADDIVVHCTSKEQALSIHQKLAERMKDCGLQLHPEKTKAAYCKES